MSTQSNRKWTRIDKRRQLAHELLESWLNGNREYVLDALGYPRTSDPATANRSRVLAALVCVAIEGGHGDRYTRALQEICERIYRER
jgi:hypothetical protein